MPVFIECPGRFDTWRIVPPKQLSLLCFAKHKKHVCCCSVLSNPPKSCRYVRRSSRQKSANAIMGGDTRLFSSRSAANLWQRFTLWKISNLRQSWDWKGRATTLQLGRLDSMLEIFLWSCKFCCRFMWLLQHRQNCGLCCGCGLWFCSVCLHFWPCWVLPGPYFPCWTSVLFGHSSAAFVAFFVETCSGEKFLNKIPRCARSNPVVLCSFLPL